MRELPDDQRGKPTTGPWEEQHYHNQWLRLGGPGADVLKTVGCTCHTGRCRVCN